MRKSLLFMSTFALLLQTAAAQSTQTASLTKEEVKSQNGQEYKDGGMKVEYIEFEDNVYSQSKNTEVGDQVELEMALRYQYQKDTFARFRFITDPEASTLDNETSNFEIILHHAKNKWVFQLDLDLNMNSGDNSATSIGPDLDSSGTFVTHKTTNNFNVTFFPYDFGGEIGDEFNTSDVTSLFYISGSPSTVSTTQANSEKVLEKTIPGFVLHYSPLKSLGLYAGMGLASYLYPTNPDFNVGDSSTLTADSWERKEDFGYKLGALYYLDKGFVKIEHAAHDKSEETGSLLESGTSVFGNYSVGRMIYAAEVTQSKAGSRAYRLDGSWFEDNTAPYSPIYSDRFGNQHTWLGKTDMAYMAKVGFGFENFVPYLSYKKLGSDFIYRERYSAHKLRNFDDSLSHGGLQLFGLGAHFYSGKYQIKPQLEYAKATNPVFANSSDVRDDRFNASLKKSDYLISILIRYSFGEYKEFRPY